MDKAKMAYGYLLLIILALLATRLGLGTVEERTSTYVMPLIVAISNLATQWASLAFRHNDTTTTALRKDGEHEPTGADNTPADS